MTVRDAPAGDAAAAARKIRVIFVCSGNSNRSQMAEAFLRHEAGDRFEVVSGGVDPLPVDPLAVTAMARIGIDISAARSKSVTTFLGQRFDYVITVCDKARASCPVFPGGVETLHWGFDDPADARGDDAQRQAVYDRITTEIAGRIHAFAPLAAAQRG